MYPKEIFSTEGKCVQIHLLHYYVYYEKLKGTFYAKMGSVKDRNGLDLTEAEDSKKRW